MTRSFLSFDSPPPDPQGSEYEEWSKKLVAWILDQRQLEEESYEEALGLGGNIVANRLFGDEGIIVDPAALQEDEIVAAPVAGKKKIIVAFRIFTDAAKGATTFQIELVKKKGADEVLLAWLEATKDVGIVGSSSGVLVLDDIDESLLIRTVINTGDDDIHWNLSWLDVD